MGGMRVIIFSGFLGSGKTSVLLSLAKNFIVRSSRVVIIENEIGDVDIDGSYLAKQGLHVQKLFGGCICCTLSAGLVETINQVETRYRPDTVLVEATGLARPGDMVRTIRQYIKTISDIKVVTVIDAVRFTDLRTMLSALIDAQIEAADYLLLNKTDMVNTENAGAIESELRGINPTARFFSTSALNGDCTDGLLEGIQ